MFLSVFSHPNLNTYMTSYMRQNGHNPCLSYPSFIYVVVVGMTLQGFLMPFIGGLASRIGPRASILAGSSLYSLGYMATYYSVQSYFPLAVFTLAFHGVGFCFVYATVIKAAQVGTLLPL